MAEQIETAYRWPDGSVKWGYPIDVGHLILQLQTLDPTMKVRSVMFIDRADGSGSKPRAYGLSMSYERWDESGWLNFQLPGPKCLAIWAETSPQNVIGLAPFDESQALLESWWNEDPEMRYAEVVCGRDLRVCVRLYEIPGNNEDCQEVKLGEGEAATLVDAIRAAVTMARLPKPSPSPSTAPLSEGL
jgi:hypothetical protein